jgi:hypothetical protein
MRVVPDYFGCGLGLQSWTASGRHLRIAIRLGLGQRDQRSKVLRGKGGIADQQTQTVAIMLIGVKSVTGSNGSLG